MPEVRLNVKVVRNVLDMAKRKPVVDRKKAQQTLQACHRSLKAHASKQLVLDPEVRTPLRTVVHNIWQVRQHVATLVRQYQSPYAD